MEYVNLVSRRLGVQLPTTLIFDYPTTSAVTTYLAGKMVVPTAASVPASEYGGLADGRSLPVPLPLTDRSVSRNVPVGIAAISVRRFEQQPGRTDAAAGRLAVPISDTIMATPLSRWDVDYEGSQAEPAVRFGAFSADVAEFDAAAFGLSASEAMVTDPQHRLLLEGAAELLATDSASLRHDAAFDMGVYVGISWTEYHRLASLHNSPVVPYSAQGAVLSVACGRVSYHFGLKVRELKAVQQVNCSK